MRVVTVVSAALLLAAAAPTAVLTQAGQSAAAPVVTGEARVWHAVALTFDGPRLNEASDSPNPFLDYRLTVRFTHEAGGRGFEVPGYFAADGAAAQSSATSGTRWRAHFTPDRPGRWHWEASFVSGRRAAIDAAAAAVAEPVPPVDGARGAFEVAVSNKSAPDFRARGRLEYVGRRYLRFAGTGEHFLKVGADSPETLLAYADFDGTEARRPAVPLKTFTPHLGDWRPGDPTWRDGKGKGLIGALNYLSSKGVTAVSFLTYNAGGDGDNVWPFVARDDKWHYDVSKLDQWQIVLDHAQRRGLYLHFKLQETENDDNTVGNPTGGLGRRGGGAAGRGAGRGAAAGSVVTALDGGALGPERRLYLREMVARFGHFLALNWNLGEENTQTADEQRAMAAYLSAVDPYDHHIVVHTHPEAHEVVYLPLIGEQSVLTGVSVQTGHDIVHERTRYWVEASTRAGRPWVVANDEQGDANLGVPPDPGYRGFAGTDPQGNRVRTTDDIRKYTLWGNLMAGGAGVEYYFGYQLPENDLVAEDFRSRDRTWDYGRIALAFFRDQRIPFWDMRAADDLVGNAAGDNSRYAFAQPGELYLVYLPAAGPVTLDLRGAAGTFTVRWFDPRRGGTLRRGTVDTVRGGSSVTIGAPPDSVSEDWLAVVRRP
jgi:hypothetical protein